MNANEFTLPTEVADFAKDMEIDSWTRSHPVLVIDKGWGRRRLGEAVAAAQARVSNRRLRSIQDSVPMRNYCREYFEAQDPSTTEHRLLEAWLEHDKKVFHRNVRPVSWTRTASHGRNEDEQATGYMRPE